jgi:hypothetical protein
MVTSEIFLSNWWNLDYPLLFSEPETLCANIQVVNTDGSPLTGIIGFVADSDGEFNFSSTYFVTDDEGRASIEVTRLAGSGDTEATVYFYNTTEFGFSQSTITMTDDCANQAAQTVTLDRPQLCTVTGQVLLEDGNSARQNLMYAIPNEFTTFFLDFALTNDNGEYSLNVVCETEYTLYDFTQFLWASFTGDADEDDYAKIISVDGSVNDDEVSDNGSVVEVEDFVGDYVEPLVVAFYLAPADQFAIIAYGTGDTFPAQVEVQVTSPDGTVVYDTLNGTIERTDDDEEQQWFFIAGQLGLDYVLPAGDDPLVATITITDAAGNVWPQEPVPIR